MLYYDEIKYNEYISEKTIVNIEKEKKIQCLFGGAFSSYVTGIDNNASDFDFYLVYDKKATEMDAFRYFDEESYVDIVMLDWNYINVSSAAYLRGIEKYPSILHRGNRKEHSANIHRADFTSQLVFEILYSDYIWDSGFLMNNLDKILRNLSFFGILDYYFTRAWGNYKQECMKEQIQAVKYLRMFLQYACMRWLLENRTIPKMDIHFMFQQYMPECFLPFFNDVLEKQKTLNVEKDVRKHCYDVRTHNLFQVTPKEMDASVHLKERTRAYVKGNKEVNHWIEDELHRLATVLQSVSETDDKLFIEKGNTAFLTRF